MIGRARHSVRAVVNNPKGNACSSRLSCLIALEALGLPDDGAHG